MRACLRRCWGDKLTVACAIAIAIVITGRATVKGPHPVTYGGSALVMSPLMTYGGTALAMPSHGARGHSISNGPPHEVQGQFISDKPVLLLLSAHPTKYAVCICVFSHIPPHPPHPPHLVIAGVDDSREVE